MTMDNFRTLWKTDKQKLILRFIWFFTFFSTFLHDGLLSFSVSGIGQLNLFRVLLPATLLLYATWAVRNRFNPWQDFSGMEKTLVCLIGVFLIHSLISLPFAIDFDFSFRRFFNLIYDLGFLILTLCICREKTVFYQTLLICLGCVSILCLMGCWEVFAGPLFFSEEYAQYVKIFGWKITSPMVNTSNTNSFMASNMFYLGICTLWWAPRITKTIHRIMAFVLLVVVYFLLECASARLLLMAFWLVFIAAAVYSVLMQGKKTVFPWVICALILFGFSNAKSIPVMKSSEEIAQEQILYTEEKRNAAWASDASSNQKEESSKTRLRLLVHAFDCFAGSKGMGVGIGNTEQLARVKKVARNGQIWSIHCFLARVLADYGVWILPPLCGYVYAVFEYTIASLKQGKKQKSRKKIGYSFLLFAVAATFILISTSPSEAQDIYAMWFFLGALPLLIRFSQEQTHGETPKVNI